MTERKSLESYRLRHREGSQDSGLSHIITKDTPAFHPFHILKIGTQRIRKGVDPHCSREKRPVAVQPARRVSVR